jgi:hypothetical protein
VVARTNRIVTLGQLQSAVLTLNTKHRLSERLHFSYQHPPLKF